MNPPRTRLDLEALVAAREIVVSCGPGGVGKTTTAAALALWAAVEVGGRVLVLTVDPARRLADALGSDGLSNEPHAVPIDDLASGRRAPRGQLDAAMIETKTSWDGLIDRHAPSPDVAAAIRANPLYSTITGRFAHSHEYIAMERLFEIHAEGNYDLIVVDTPPSRSALDVLDAPQKMADYFSSGVAGWLAAPARSRLVGLASRPFYQVAERVLGSQFLEDIVGFFRLLAGMSDGFVDRARAVDRLIRSNATTFMAVTTLEAGPCAETERLIAALDERHCHHGVLVANRTLPSSLRDLDAEMVATSLREDGERLLPALFGAMTGGPVEAANPDEVRRGLGVLREIGENFENFRLVAHREAELFSDLSRRHAYAVRVPFLFEEVHDLRGLLEIGHLLAAGGPVQARRASGD